MFDIFTTHADGSPQFVISVGYLGQAQEIARELSRLVPGECFGYFERTEEAEVIATWKGPKADALTN